MLLCPGNGLVLPNQLHIDQIATNSTVQQGFRYRVLLATKSRRNHRQRTSGQRGKVGDDPSTASSSANGYEARHPASYFYYLAGIMESAVG
ncbi:hypothetical protein TNCV_4310421 [Trichonephila clavipes]|nr:hypothetical protein TNCV_4310421 [Trichonephila clavipes]